MIRLRRGADPDLVIRHPDGFHTAIAMSCTDYAAPSAHMPQVLSPPPLLDFTGLCQAAQLIDELRQSGRFPAEASANERKEVGYD